jgi:hypothetical protein
MRMKVIWISTLFMDFQHMFLKTYQKPKLFCKAKILRQENSEFAECILQDVKKTFFLSSKAIILQSI